MGWELLLRRLCLVKGFVNQRVNVSNWRSYNATL